MMAPSPAISPQPRHSAPGLLSVRNVEPPLTMAARIASPWPKPRGSNPAAKAGLRYEAKVRKALEAAFPSRVEANPFFEFRDARGRNLCSPDALVHLGPEILVVEVKLTFVPSALPKLRGLYCPVVSRALGGIPCTPLLICHNLTPTAPRASFTLSEAVVAPEPILQWLENFKLQV